MPVQRSQERRRPQVPRSNELAKGLAAPSGAGEAARAAKLAAVTRGPGGKLASSSAAAALGSLGGKAKAERDRRLRATPQLVRVLGLHGVADAAFAAYLPDAEEFARAECARLARDVGGGVIGFGPSSMVQSAALQLAGSRFSFDRGDLVTGSRLADASRANLMSARDECAREAVSRPKSRDAFAWLPSADSAGASPSAFQTSGDGEGSAAAPNASHASASEAAE